MIARVAPWESARFLYKVLRVTFKSELERLIALPPIPPQFPANIVLEISAVAWARCRPPPVLPAELFWKEQVLILVFEPSVKNMAPPTRAWFFSKPHCRKVVSPALETLPPEAVAVLFSNRQLANSGRLFLSHAMAPPFWAVLSLNTQLEIRGEELIHRRAPPFFLSVSPAAPPVKVKPTRAVLESESAMMKCRPLPWAAMVTQPGWRVPDHRATPGFILILYS